MRCRLEDAFWLGPIAAGSNRSHKKIHGEKIKTGPERIKPRASQAVDDDIFTQVVGFSDDACRRIGNNCQVFQFR